MGKYGYELWYDANCITEDHGFDSEEEAIEEARSAMEERVFGHLMKLYLMKKRNESCLIFGLQKSSRRKTIELHYISRSELPKYWETKSICIEFADGSDALAQENGYTLEECLQMEDAKFFLD